MRLVKIVALPVLIICSFSAKAQTSVNTKIWYQQDSATDFVDGISLDKAYDFLKGKNQYL